MAHFLKPVEAPPECYTVDNKLAPGSLARVTIPTGGSLEVALWGGASLHVSSNNNPVVPSDRITERQVDDLRVLKLYGVSSGSAILQTGGSVTLPITVGAVAGLAQPLLQQAKDVAAKGAALAALADPAINKIQLSIDGFTISSSSYAQVRQKINSGSIQVKFNSRLSNGPNGYPYAFYHAPTNVLNLGFSTATTAPRKGLIVHEATHAACDIVPYSSMTTVTSEVLAYIAQAIFMLEKDPFPEVQADPIICCAQVLAGMIKSGSQLKVSDLKSLRDAISSSPEYSGKAARPGYDGVP